MFRKNNLSTTQTMHQPLLRNNKFVGKKQGTIEHKKTDFTTSVKAQLMAPTLFALVAKGVFSRKESK